MSDETGGTRCRASVTGETRSCASAELFLAAHGDPLLPPLLRRFITDAHLAVLVEVVFQRLLVYKEDL